MAAVCFSIEVRVTAEISCATARAAALFQCRSCIIGPDEPSSNTSLDHKYKHYEWAMQKSFANVILTCKTSILHKQQA